MTAIVKTLSLSRDHTFSKTLRDKIRLVVGLGVEGDVHGGVTVKHRSRVARDPTQPNLRQVHLIHSELFTELWASGFDVHFGQMGENITTEGIDLLGLPRDTRLSIGTQMASSSVSRASRLSWRPAGRSKSGIRSGRTYHHYRTARSNVSDPTRLKSRPVREDSLTTTFGILGTSPKP